MKEYIGIILITIGIIGGFYIGIWLSLNEILNILKASLFLLADCLFALVFVNLGLMMFSNETVGEYNRGRLPK
jgi:hypothetical protein